MQLAVISRRSRFRAGTRYFRRGIDTQGHVANFNETEQILFADAGTTAVASDDDFPIKMSYVQVRGSVPLFWSEVPTLRYVPDLLIMELPGTVRPLSHCLATQLTLSRTTPCAVIWMTWLRLTVNKSSSA